MLTSILTIREIAQTLGQSLTRPLPDFMEFVVMDAFLVILLLFVFLFVRKIVKLLIRLVKRPRGRDAVTVQQDINKEAAENALSKAEAAQQLLAASKKTKNPFKLLGRLFGSLFGKLGGVFKWLFKLPVKLVGILVGLLRRKKKDEPAAAPETVQSVSAEAGQTYNPAAESPTVESAASSPSSLPPSSMPEDVPLPAPPPAAPIPQSPTPAAPTVAESIVPPVAAPQMPASSVAPQPSVEMPTTASELLPEPAVSPPPKSQSPVPQPNIASTADESTLTAAFEQELRNAQQAESQLHELKVKAAATALQKGSLAANRSVEEALPWYEKAAELDPGSATAQLGLSRLYKETGNLLGAFEAAQKAFAGTEDQQTQSLALEGMDQVIVAKSDETIGPETIEAEPVAPEPVPKTLAEITGLLNADPDNPDLQRDLSIAYDEMGDGHAEHDNLVGALECFEASLMIVGRLAKSYPDELVYLRDFSVCQEKIGEIQNALGNREGAIAAYEESIPIVTMLANRFPDEEEYLFDLKITKDRLAELKAAT
ncbi:MAG: hypothetical protein GKS01_14245 [Alphaproteobacteria bacterium]|nr:hypothetical protein [Alphaproteobacteria bacterium]